MSDVLSKAPDMTPAQIEGFLGDRPLAWGRHKKIRVGKVFLNFYCRRCDDQRTFESRDELSCLGLSERSVSIDTTLRCTACQASVEAWFLVCSDGDISGRAPTVRVERYTENLRDCADRVGTTAGQFAELLRCAQLAFEAQLGAGSMIYLRKIFESITYEVAQIQGIATRGRKDGRRPFREILQEVDKARHIIPHRFTSNGYQLFSELSEVIHGNSSEEDALLKYRPCRQLVVGVVEEVNRDNVFAKAIEELGWNVDSIEEIAGEEAVS
ncbi:hypothetical protein [Mycolicibacterium houstonense]|uniref:hypothetical protein n=1 Tax=Mycolicibacterium houstonense TaxID=146021 RepID=UPI003F9D3CCD